MEKSKILEIYRSLGVKERNRLVKFISSPYYNESDILIKMNEFICHEINQQQIDELDLKKLFTYIYGRKKFNLGLIRYFMSRLNILLEQFIATEFQKENMDDITLGVFFNERKVEKYYIDIIKSLENQLKETRINNHFQLARYVAMQELVGTYNYSNLNKYLKHIETLDEKIESEINLFFVITKIKQICASENFKLISGINKKVFLADTVLNLIENVPSFKKNIIINIYYTIYKSFIDIHVGAEELYALVNKNIHKIEKEELRPILSYTQNYCLRQINKGKLELQNTLLNIYKISIDKGVITENNYISESNYNNIIFLGLRLKQFDWTLQFLKNHIQLIDKDKRENTYNFNMARYYFFQKKFDKALISLREVELNDLFYGIDVRSLLLKIYYETSEREAFYNLLISFRAFIKRKKMVAISRQKSYSNMMKYAKKIMLISFKSKAKLDLLNKEIQSLNPCADKGWLLEKLQEKYSIRDK